MVAHGQPCTWEALPETEFGDLVRIRALLPFDDGQGQALFAAGTFREATGSPGDRIARWDGERWYPLGRGLSGSAHALERFDDGRGPALYAGGSFGRAGEISGANGIARWDGAEWSALGAGLYHEAPLSPHSAMALLGFDDGSGPALYVGGEFTHADGIPAYNVARWDGERWSAMGDGLTGWAVRDFAIYDDGSGLALYAGGYLDIGGVARWDGQSWSRVGESFVGHIDAMAVFDDGTGPSLYAGGQMHTSVGHPGDGIARWDGERWIPLRGGVDYDVRSMHVFDDGTGPALYVGGAFHHADGKPVWGIAKWDGEEWHEVGGGLYHLRGQSVNALTTFDDGGGPALYVAGQFSAAGELPGIPVQNIARWRCERAGCYADCDGDGQLTFFDFLCFQNLFAAGDPLADCDESGELDFFDFLCFQNAFAAGCE